MGGAKTEDEFKDGSDPTVLIVVIAGQTLGLEIGAKRVIIMLWTDRYEALYIHDPVCEFHISDYEDDS